MIESKVTMIVTILIATSKKLPPKLLGNRNTYKIIGML